MTINWQQVLEIETYLTNTFKRNFLAYELLWRNPQTIDIGLRVDKNKSYSFEDLQNYLLTKYPKDEMIKQGAKVTKQIFMACASGTQLCEIDHELLEINENQDIYRLSIEILKNNLLSECAEYTGSTSFFIFCLKIVIDSGVIDYSGSMPNKDAREELAHIYFGFLNQLGNFKPDIFGLKREKCLCHFSCTEIIKETFQKLKADTIEFMSNVRFTSYIKSCNKNHYAAPYSDDEKNNFITDLFNLSIKEVLEIINQDTKDYFQFKLKNNPSPYAQDIKKRPYGNLVIFISLVGLINFRKITELKYEGELLPIIKNILSREFIILQTESINDEYNPHIKTGGNSHNSSLIVGKDITQKKLYNQYLDNFQEKVLKGFVWYNDDVNGISYSYLGFSDSTDNIGEYKRSIPFENVIFKYFIAYLNRSWRDRSMEDDLQEKGYWYSKDEYVRKIKGFS